jgi:hypothetical protein
MRRQDFQETMRRAQAALEDLFPAAVTFRGQVITAAGAGGRKRAPMEEGGYEEELTRVVRIPKAALAQAPEPGERMTIDGVVCRVAAVSVRDWDVAWTVEAVPL